MSVSALPAFVGFTENKSVTVTAVTIELDLFVCVREREREADTLRLSSALINDSGQVADVAIHTN